MDIELLKKKAESLNPVTHGALRDALSAEYARLTGKSSEDSSPIPPASDPLLLIFQRAADAINKQYIKGTIAYISRHHPGLDKRINEAEADVNVIWFKCERGEATIDEFKEKVENWYRLNLQAIKIYAQECSN
jgi:hypothetical protein